VSSLGSGRRAWLIDPRFIRFRLAFVIALVWGALHLLFHPGEVVPVAADSAKYDAFARSIETVLHQPSLGVGMVSGRLAAAERDSLGFDRWEFQHAPAYVVPLGILYAIFPNDFGIGRAFSLLLYALSAGLLLRLADRLIGRRLAWAALGLYLLYLPFLYYGLGIATEGASAFYLLLSATLLLAFHRRESDRGALLAGLGIALLFLAKTTFHAIALLALGYEALRLLRRGARGRALRLAIAALAPLQLWTACLAAARIPLNPLGRAGEDALWAYRGNYVPNQGWETTGLGDAITSELRDASRGLPMPGPMIEEKDYAIRRTMYWRALGLTIERHPVDWAALAAKKFGLFWTYPSRKVLIHTVAGAWAIPRWFHLLLFPLGLLGIARTAGRRSATWIPGAFALGVAATHALTHLVARYHLPVLAIFLVYALLGAKALAGWARIALRRLRRDGLLRAPWKWAALALGAGLLGALLLRPPLPVGPGAGRALYLAGALVAGFAPLALAPFLLGVSGARRRRGWVVAAVALFCLPRAGTALGELDWDRFAVRLDRAGESLIQEIALPPALRSGANPIDSTWVEIDMLRILRGSFRLEVLAQG
jgi:hypothetical protein